MTELEKLERARMYLDKLANGIDPLTDQELPDDTMLNNVRLARCFFYAADVLRRVIENGGEEPGTNTVHCSVHDVSYYINNGYKVRRLRELG